MNYNGKKFRTRSNSSNGETTSDTVFFYSQEGNLVKATYSGGKIKFGHLIGIVYELGSIDMRYHQVNTHDELLTGICYSRPELLSNGKIRLHETWQWTSGENSKGTFIIEEM